MSKQNNRKKDVFWISFSDLMTSLFFVMLVLFILVFTLQRQVIDELEKSKQEYADLIRKMEEQSAELKAKAKELDRIKEIEKAINNINKKYFKYDDENKKHILNIQFLFPSNSANIDKIKPNKKPDLVAAGKAIKDLILKFPKEDNIKYLIVVEGQSSNDNWKGNDKLSYYRAQSLIKLWEKNRIGLEKIKNCELVIAGSGEGGIPRMQPDKPPANQRILITIIPKIGEFKE